MNISYNPTLGLYFATVPRKEHRTVNLDASGHATGHADLAVSTVTVPNCTVQVVLAYGSFQPGVVARATKALEEGM